MRFVGVIPARYNSSRIPGKPLIEIAGRPMIQWVYDRASQASSLAEVLVATEDERVLRTVEGFWGKGPDDAFRSPERNRPGGRGG